MIKCYICKNLICKYKLNVNGTNSIYLASASGYICCKCAKFISQRVINEFYDEEEDE